MGGSPDQSSSLWLKCLGRRIDHSLGAVEVTANMRRPWFRHRGTSSTQTQSLPAVLGLESGQSIFLQAHLPRSQFHMQNGDNPYKWTWCTPKNGYNEPSRGPVAWLSRLCKLDNLSSVPGTHSGRWELLQMKHLLVSCKRLALTMMTKNSWAPVIFLLSLLSSWNHKAHHFSFQGQHKSSISAMMEGFIILE